MISVNVYISKKRFASFEIAVRRAAKAALRALKNNDCSIDIHLISRAEMRKLNRILRGKDKPTNILSFEGKSFVRGDAGSGKKYIGEVFLAPEIISERGEDAGYLVIHGILHCVGYTHSTDRGRIMMEKKECELLKYAKHHNRT